MSKKRQKPKIRLKELTKNFVVNHPDEEANPSPTISVTEVVDQMEQALQKVGVAQQQLAIHEIMRKFL